MKRTMLFVMAGLLLGGAAYTGYADTDGDATVHVYVEVLPNVAVGAPFASVSAGSVQSGEFSCTITFTVDANLQKVWLSAEVTPLFKGDDPNGTEVPPIPIDLTKGVEITCDHATPTGASDNILDYVTPGTLDGFPSQSTDSTEFESSQNNHFSQNVYAKVTWNQDDPEKPTGEYSGLVKLMAVIVP
ncbi:MAG TPA: hypothetical protein VNA25_09965 [Phycisphaerae bacterium]|nr:hypothetical protein [Phycisphaerae bacterium]